MRPHLGIAVRWCRGAMARWWPRARVSLASYWTAGIAWAVMTVLHARWYARGGSGAEVLSGYGASLVALGLWVAALELLRLGIDETARRQTEENPIWFAEQVPAFEAAQKAAKIDARRTILIERVAAGVIAAAGTVLNGYGAPLAHRWHLHG